jgi:glutaredoxin
MLIEVFVAPRGCPSCGTAQRLVSRVAARHPGVAVKDVDLLEAAERAARYNVFTTPFIVVDGELAFVGVPRESELEAYLSSRLDAGRNDLRADEEQS